MLVKFPRAGSVADVELDLPWQDQRLPPKGGEATAVLRRDSDEVFREAESEKLGASFAGWVI